MGKSILLVDDSGTVQQLVRLAFEDEGIEVNAASSVSEARHFLSTRSPDVILADVSLPDDDSFAFVRELRARPETTHTPIILLATSPIEPNLSGLAGADAVLGKPFESIALLVSTVRDLSRRPSRIAQSAEAAKRQSQAPEEGGMDSILELDEPPSSAASRIDYDELVASLVPIIAEMVADRVVEQLNREVVARAVPEVVEAVLKRLRNDLEAQSKAPLE